MTPDDDRSRWWQRLGRRRDDAASIGLRPRRTLYQRLHGYAYLRWPYGYIGAAIGERRADRWRRLLYAPFLWRALYPQRWAAEYHGKVVPTSAAGRLLTVREDVAVTLPEQVIPHATARDLLLRHTQPIVALDCPCRMARENPCLPLDVCLIVGEPFASLALKHQPDHTRAISAEEALQILDAEAARGHVHHAFFKEALYGRFYAICNCCSCCCGAISAQRHGTPMAISSGYVAAHDSALCSDCGACAEACPFEAIDLERDPVVDVGCCMGCGVCANACPTGALELVRDPGRGEPLDVDSLVGVGAGQGDGPRGAETQVSGVL